MRVDNTLLPVYYNSLFFVVAVHRDANGVEGGELALGGVDASKVAGNFTYHKVTRQVRNVVVVVVETSCCTLVTWRFTSLSLFLINTQG